MCKAFKDVAAAEKEMRELRAKIHNELKSKLTSEQQAALEGTRMAKRDKMHARREFGRSFMKEWIEVYSK